MISKIACLAAASLLLTACGDSGNTGGEGGTGAQGGAAGQGGTGAQGGAAGQGGAGAQGGAAGGSGGGTAGSGAGFIPDPIPVIDEEPPAPCQAAIDDPYYFQFLDDLCDAKKQPTTQDRDRACPSLDLSPDIQLADGTVVTYKPSSAPVEVDGDALKGIVPDAMDVTVILIRRVNGVPHYRYLSNGTHDIPYQPWSTTKVLAAANAAATLRIQSDYKVGLTAAAGATPLGDLVTSVCNYDYDPYSSNGLGRYFHDIGGRAKANDLIHALWLNRPAAETFGGNYGSPAPPLGYTFEEPSGDSVTITPDQTSGPANHLSSFTTAEAIKRLVLHREEPDQRLPGIQWADIRVLLHGAESSAKYGPWGGMTQDTAIYLQTGHDIDYIEAAQPRPVDPLLQARPRQSGPVPRHRIRLFPRPRRRRQPRPRLGPRIRDLGPPPLRRRHLERARPPPRQGLPRHPHPHRRRPPVERPAC